MNYSQKLTKEAGLSVGSYVPSDKPAIEDPKNAQNKAASALKQAVVLSYFPVILWGFAGALSGGFLDGPTIRLILAVSSLFWFPASAAIRECRTVLGILKCENIFRYVLADAVRSLTAMTLLVWLPIWALFVFMAKETVYPPATLVGGAATVLLALIRHTSVICKQYEKPKRFRWVEAWG